MMTAGWLPRIVPLVVSTVVAAGPVEVYRTGPEFCPHDRTADSSPITDQQAIQRARALLPGDFCGPNTFVTGCDADSEWANGAWRVFVQQYKRSGDRKDAGGLTHSYVILDRVGNCLANIPGTELGGRN
ncbi:MAG TPA: hypothetical protein VGK44_02290 [Casimicrobiaceae bacterium]|jgi:hypothetical protein